VRACIMVCGAVAAMAVASLVQAATVSTLAGSGKAGIANGRANAASFLLPTGVAWAPNGDLYVTDAGAQRIRVVRADGRVETLAGSGAVTSNGLWVEGGYADGVGQAAKFNVPSAVAVGPHGELYVADTNNHCIRLVSPSGRVTTFAGNPSKMGDDNGERRDARFMFPRSLAVDRDGNLYIADPLSGVRRVTPSGTVSVIPLPVNEPREISVSPTGAPVLFVTNDIGFWVVELSSFNGTNNVKRVSRFFAGPRRFFSPSEYAAEVDSVWLLAAEGERSIGYPYAVSALDAGGVVYTDLRTQTVRFLDTAHQETAILGGQGIEDAANYGGGFADGNSAESRFDAPMGIAARSDGVIAVADSGNRRIRLVQGIDRSQPVDPALQFLPARDLSEKQYRIAYIGNSFVWTNVRASGSIGGQVERQLERDRALHGVGKNVRVVTVRMGSTFEPLQQYIDAVAAAHAVDAVVLQVNSFFSAFSFGVPLGSKSLIGQAEKWQMPTRAALRKMNTTLKNAGIPLLIVSHPLGDEISLAEQPYATIESPIIHAPPDGKLESLFNAAVADAGAPWLNMWAVFGSELRSATHKPLFLAIDGHFTPHANDVMAAAIARKLEQLHPWSR